MSICSRRQVRRVFVRLNEFDWQGEGPFVTTVRKEREIAIGDKTKICPQNMA